MKRIILHSSGPWKEHKYIKIVNGRYYYSNGDSREWETSEADAKMNNYIYNVRDEKKGLLGKAASKVARALNSYVDFYEQTGVESTYKYDGTVVSKPKLKLKPHIVQAGKQAYEAHAFDILPEGKNNTEFVAGAKRSR